MVKARVEKKEKNTPSKKQRNEEVTSKPGEEIQISKILLVSVHALSFRHRRIIEGGVTKPWLGGRPKVTIRWVGKATWILFPPRALPIEKARSG